MTGNVDFFIRFGRARRDEHNGVSQLRICCQIKTLEGVAIWSGMVENAGIAVVIRFAICFRSTVTSTPGFRFRFRGRHFSYRCRPMSGNVDSVIFGSGMVENVG